MQRYFEETEWGNDRLLLFFNLMQFGVIFCIEKTKALFTAVVLLTVEIQYDFKTGELHVRRSQNKNKTKFLQDFYNSNKEPESEDFNLSCSSDPLL